MRPWHRSGACVGATPLDDALLGGKPRGSAVSLYAVQRLCRLAMRVHMRPRPARSIPPRNGWVQANRWLAGERSKPHGGSLTCGRPAAAAKRDLPWGDFSRCFRTYARPGQLGLRNPGRSQSCIYMMPFWTASAALPSCNACTLGVLPNHMQWCTSETVLRLDHQPAAARVCLPSPRRHASLALLSG
jgi:hypothetical protein